MHSCQFAFHIFDVAPKAFGGQCIQHRSPHAVRERNFDFEVVASITHGLTAELGRELMLSVADSGQGLVGDTG